jgi:wobble nucleotide-excising tRNase
MIEKFITIKGIGLLHNALPSGALALKKINAIYAENGRGKSTFAAMCRSLSTGDAQTILVKRSFGGQHEPEVHLRIHGQNYQFRDGQWDKSYSKILVYDEDFVEKNVYSGNRIEAMHRENWLEFALGETGVSLKKEIDAITEEIEGINTELRNLEREINQQKGPYQVAEFVALQPGPDVDSRLAQAAKRLNDAENIDALKRRPSLSPIIMPEFNLGDIEQLLASSLDDVAEDAECKVKMHIEQCLGSGAENWNDRA